jgi:ribosome-interacting GTPase 1
MPTNVSPEYKRAREAYQRARDPADRLACLQEMLRTVPKHKGTEHLQAEIKTKIKELAEELAGPKKGAARTGPTHTIRPEGAAQVALVGPPNSGKSSLHARLTGSHAETGPYPFTTQVPLPGMLLHQDVQFQLVDLPPISPEHMEAWMPNALQGARAALLVVDLSVAGCVEAVAVMRERLEAKRITLTDDWGGALAPGLAALEALSEAPQPQAVPATTGAGAADEDSADTLDDPFHIRLPTLLVAGKCDLVHYPEEIAALEELLDVRYPAIAASATTGEGLEGIGAMLFRGLGVVRVYTKIPGHPPDMSRPFTVFRGQTVHDVARLVHREMAETLKFARIWGSGRFDGQQIGRDHVVSDGDVVELHA